MTRSDEQLNRQAFPVLSEARIELLRRFGEVRATCAGDVLFAVGDPDYSLVVVLKGWTETVERSKGADRVLKTSGPASCTASSGC
jgi:hypothetical protein